MSLAILSTLKTSTNVYLDNTALSALTHISYIVPSTPGTSQSITIENVGSVRSVASVYITRAGVCVTSNVVVTFAGNVITIANGAGYTLTAADEIDMIVVGDPT